MNDTYQKQSDPVVDYVIHHKWSVDQKAQRKHYLHRLAQNSRQNPDIATKIGGMLIYNQVIEQLLADIVEMSVYYIKASIWPEQVDLKVELDKATFGRIIEEFRQFAPIEENREQILTALKKFNTKRNQVVHDLFDVEDMGQLARELDQYAKLADQIIRLLSGYDDQIACNFRELEKRKQFHT